TAWRRRCRRLSERGCNAQPEKGGHNGGRPNHSTHDFLRLAAGTGSARVLFECESTIPRGCRLNEDRNTDRGGAGELVRETRAGAEQHPSLGDRTARESARGRGVGAATPGVRDEVAETGGGHASTPGTLKCPPDSLQVGPTCADKYEASVWQI